MKKRPVSGKYKNLKKVFLACEFKPKTALWSVLDPFAYDIEPAYTYGKLGVICYKPEAYSIVNIDKNDEPLVGYLLTITHPDTVLLLDKIKGYNGENAFNTHIKTPITVYTAPEQATKAWAYILSDHVLRAYQQIEQIEWGHWSDDPLLTTLLDKITQ